MKRFFSQLKHKMGLGEFHRYRWEKELLWAEIYHDTIRSMPHLQQLALSPGRMAANYSLLYVLVRILRDARPQSILEFGLGQSSLLIDQFPVHCHTPIRHVIVEEDEKWVTDFCQNHALQHILCVPDKQQVRAFGRDIPVASLPKEVVKTPFQLYLIDGPRGTDRYSRFTICEIARQWDASTECMVLLDDYDRWGERETGQALIRICKQKGMPITHRVINGLTDQLLLFTPAFDICRSF
jgi:hypothetical protein